MRQEWGDAVIRLPHHEPTGHAAQPGEQNGHASPRVVMRHRVIRHRAILRGHRRVPLAPASHDVQPYHLAGRTALYHTLRRAPTRGAVCLVCLSLLAGCGAQHGPSRSDDALPSPTVRPALSASARPTIAASSPTVANPTPSVATPASLRCSSPRGKDPAAPGRTERFSYESSLSSYMQNRRGSAAVAMRYPGCATIYAFDTGSHDPYITASVVKLSVMATVMVQAHREGRDLTATEKSLIEPMITESDNDATTELWTRVGEAPAVQKVLRSMGADQTTPSTQGWGLTTTTARDQVVIMSHFAMKNPIIPESMRRYAINLLGHVDDEQTWGMTAAIPHTVDRRVKNGWLPHDNAWHVNSVAAMDGPEGMILAGLSRAAASTMEYQISTLESLAGIVAVHEHPQWPAKYPQDFSSTGARASQASSRTATPR